MNHDPTAIRPISIQPNGALATFVEQIWLGPALPQREQTFVIEPDGRVDIVLAFDARGGDVVAFGSTTRATQYTLDPSRHYLGVRLKPGKHHAFLDLNPSELRDAHLPVDRLRSLRTDVLLEISSACDASPQVIDAIVAHLTPLVHGLDVRQSLIDALIQYIERHKGVCSIDDLAHQAGLSVRQLERLFNAEIGIAPKLFARIVRYNQVRHALASGSRLNADLAARFGYTDQSHLWRDYHSLAQPQTT